MKHITILVPRGALLGSIEGPRQVFAEANKYLIRQGRMPLFRVELAALDRETAAAGGLYQVTTDTLVRDIGRTDLVLIPALDGDLVHTVEANGELVPWIVRQYKTGAEVASLCVGAFLLAATGLVDRRKCATHWMAAQEFRRLYPEVDLVEDKIITDEHGIYTSGGAFSYLNL
ncbi:MAG TPA: DJ-1/PfpI family protein, partial [Chitinophagaceae bacterium]|nr:DJ-1/PfpI family protein [Chitinophagaceae bacterium]